MFISFISCSRRSLSFLVAFTAIMGLGAMTTQLPLHAQSSGLPGDTIPGETIPPDAPAIFLPLVSAAEAPPDQLPLSYASLPVEPPPSDRPAEAHPDLNLALRGFVETAGHLGLVNYGGDTDPQAPQIDGMFDPPRLPTFPALYQVYDWNWGCAPPAGCRGEPISGYPVTLLEMATAVNEQIRIPRRAPSITGDFNALVLYADARRLTITYTRRDTAAVGYLVHLEDFAVNPGLIALYQSLNAAGRGALPALRNGEIVGVADRGALRIATRDTGAFLDPRACKDWWQGYLSQCSVQLRRPRH